MLGTEGDPETSSDTLVPLPPGTYPADNGLREDRGKR